MCGENTRPTGRATCTGGSSPRVRGKHPHVGQVPSRNRLIPACAGKTEAGCYRLRLPTAHPRVCGENQLEPTALQTTTGSSPRVRGKPREPLRSRARTRLIPACAGKTCASLSARFRRWAHPRVCGENLVIATCLGDDQGSSPRVRGKRLTGGESVGSTGLIPACAGKTRSSESRAKSRRAHPRVCGENYGTIAEDSHEAGSSPRVRGKQLTDGTVGTTRGLIPACAGKTRRAPN